MNIERKVGEIMPYQLNAKMRNRTTYEVDTNTYEVRLDANESYYDPGKLFRSEVAEIVSRIPLNRYPDDTYADLRKAFGTYYGVDPELVVAGNGSDELLGFLIGGFLMKEEILLTFSPDFSMYGVFSDLYESTRICIEKPEGTGFDADFIKKSAEDCNAAMVLFSNPSSPKSAILSRMEIEKLVKSTQALVVVDEAYMDFADESVIDLIEKYDNLVVLKTCSKAFGCAAIRLGFAAASKEVAKALSTVRPPYNLNSITAAIGAFIYTQKEYLAEAVSSIRKGREFLVEKLTEMEKEGMLGKVYPSHTNCIYVETDRADFYYEALKKDSILVRKFNNALRITVGSQDENQRFLAGLRKAAGKQ